MQNQPLPSYNLCAKLKTRLIILGVFKVINLKVLISHSTTVLTGINNRFVILNVGVEDGDMLSFYVFDIVTMQKYAATMSLKYLADDQFNISIMWYAPNGELCDPYDDSIEKLIVKKLESHFKNVLNLS
jgi:hypothetical protein